jgi:ABC-type transporter MlaC component
MKSILKNPANLLIMAIMVLALAACGGGGSSPEVVAEKYLKALFNDDYGTQKKFASEKELKDVEKRQKEAGQKEGGQEIPKEKKELMEKFKAMTPKAEQANISEDGNSAKVKVEMLDKDGKSEMVWKVDLVKEKDGWKVDKLGK